MEHIYDPKLESMEGSQKPQPKSALLTVNRRLTEGLLELLTPVKLHFNADNLCENYGHILPLDDLVVTFYFVSISIPSQQSSASLWHYRLRAQGQDKQFPCCGCRIYSSTWIDTNNKTNCRLFLTQMWKCSNWLIIFTKKYNFVLIDSNYVHLHHFMFLMTEILRTAAL